MKGKLFWIGGVVVLLLAVGVTIGLANTGETYHACVNNSSGTIHMINKDDYAAGERCNPNNEVLVSWNQIGPPGPPGSDGADGEPGPQGEQGPQGPPGAKGDKGDTGEQGLQGLPGPPGEDGAPGADGQDGAPGADGADGTSCTVLSGFGKSRILCSDGSSAMVYDGADGADGAQGPPGPEGPQGPKGDEGDFSGIFESPSGQYSISVTDTGIILSGTGGEISITNSGIQILSATSLLVESQANSEYRVGIGSLVLKAPSVHLNGLGGIPVVRLTDPVLCGPHAPGGNVLCHHTTASSSVFAP